MSQAFGTIVQTIGAVIDIEFPRDAMPKIYDALIQDPARIEQTLRRGAEKARDRVVADVAPRQARPLAAQPSKQEQ